MLILTKQSGPAQHGQTLIETVVAIFVLVMGITAALGLATFSLNSSNNVAKQLIGMGLAREGIEAFKNMRDTNWLQSTLDTHGCYNYVTSTDADAPCYTSWLNPQAGAGGYNIDPGAGGSVDYILAFYPGDNQPEEPNYFWHIEPPGSGWGLNYDPTGASGGENGFYYAPPGGSELGTPDEFGATYFRGIVVTRESLAPYDEGSNGNLNRLRVESRVWWQGKNCAFSRTWDTAAPACRISLTTFLTNWKNYE